MSKIITISGKAEHGKDLTATMLKDKLEAKGKRVLIVHYADYLKFICEKYFGWDGKKDEKGRTLLQQIGTEKVRFINPNFWVSVVSRLINIFEDDFNYFVIPDTRFPNEIQYLREMKYKVIALHIERIGYENHLTPEQRNHPSETALDNYRFDYYINSVSGIEYLSKEVDKFINFVEVKK